MDKKKIRQYTKRDTNLINNEEVNKMSTAANSFLLSQTAYPEKESSGTISAVDYRKKIARKSVSIIGRTFEDLYKEGQ